MVNKEEKIKSLNNNKKIEYKDLMSDLFQMQNSSTKSIKNIVFQSEDKQIIEMDEKKSLKIFDSIIKKCDFLNIALNTSFDPDQRMMEGNIFEDCSFIECSGIASMKDSVFINCSFASSDFRQTDFINCYFENVSASDCDFRRANFSLANYKDIYISECNTEESSLYQIEKVEEEIKDDRFEKTGVHLLRASLDLLYDAMGFCDKDKGRIESFALELAEIIHDKESIIEKESVRQLDVNEVYENIARHEKWASQIVRDAIKPDINWREGNYKGIDFSGKNLMDVDFSGSILKGCDFSSSILAGVNFTNCDLTGAIFNHSVFSDNCFDGAILKDISMDRKNMQLFQNAGIIAHLSETGTLNTAKDRKIMI